LAQQRAREWSEVAGIPLEALFDQIPDMVFFMKDAEARYTVVNQTLVNRCGVGAKEDLIGKTVLDIFPSPLGEGYYEQDGEVLAKGTPVRDLLELHLYVRGEAGWCITNKIPVEDDDGTVTGLIGISKDLHLPASQARGYRELAESIRFIQVHYSETLKVEELARMSSLSEYQYERRMKKAFQLTAGQFITKTRVEAACELLRATEKQIVDVAVECGFYDQSAFSRQFKATTGLTPSGYRTQMKGK
jgi:PAS domain S-box-containing protein